jgi:ABC-type multidrug transport system ATPase subunit
VDSTSAVAVANLAVVARNRGQRKSLLAGIDFGVLSGQLVGVIGASGCGKSTLIRALAGQVAPSQGHVLFAGHSIADIKHQYPLAVGYPKPG